MNIALLHEKLNEIALIIFPIMSNCKRNKPWHIQILRAQYGSISSISAQKEGSPCYFDLFLTLDDYEKLKGGYAHANNGKPPKFLDRKKNKSLHDQIAPIIPEICAHMKNDQQPVITQQSQK